MIYVRTCAYNAEKTLRRAMDSILNQTYGELTYYVRQTRLVILYANMREKINE